MATDVKLLINPKKITDYNRSDRDLELFWYFAMFVAGKNAGVTAQKVTEMFSPLTENEWPREYLGGMNDRQRLAVLKKYGIGQYTRLGPAVKGSLTTDLRKTSAIDLERIPGVGPKTAKFFVLHSRRGAKCVPLDTWILAFLRDKGVDAPMSTPPSGRKYDALEAVAIQKLQAEYPGKTLAAADLLTWRKYSGNDD